MVAQSRLRITEIFSHRLCPTRRCWANRGAAWNSKQGRAAARAWLRGEQRAGSRAARPVLLLSLFGTILAIGQAFCVAFLLAGAVSGRGGQAAWLLGGFAVLAVLRAGLTYASETAAFNAGAAARRRLRSDALTRLLHAGPAMLRQRHSGDLAAIVVDRVEALDGLYSRWIPAASFAVAGPVLVLLAAALGGSAGPGWCCCCAGLLVPVAMAAAGIGAAAASRSQFLALARLQARFLDRVRGIATIVLAGRAEAEAQCAGRGRRRAARRTMRVLRVAFLSSAALDLAAAAGAGGAGGALRPGVARRRA